MTRLRRAFGVVSQPILRNPKLGISQKGMYALLCSYADSDGQVVAGNDRLAADLGCTDRYVRDLLGDLVKAGVVERVAQYQDGRQIVSKTRLLDAVTSPRQEPEFPHEEESLFPLGGEPEFLQNKTSKNKTSINPPTPQGGRRTGTPASFPITGPLRTWAREHAPGVDLDRETENFLGHHRAKGNTFKDWNQAWQNWMRRSAESTPTARRNGTGTMKGIR